MDLGLSQKRIANHDPFQVPSGRSMTRRTPFPSESGKQSDFAVWRGMCARDARYVCRESNLGGPVWYVCPRCAVRPGMCARGARNVCRESNMRSPAASVCTGCAICVQGEQHCGPAWDVCTGCAECVQGEQHARSGLGCVPEPRGGEPGRTRQEIRGSGLPVEPPKQA